MDNDVGVPGVFEDKKARQPQLPPARKPDAAGGKIYFPAWHQGYHLLSEKEEGWHILLQSIYLEVNPMQWHEGYF